MESRRDEVDMNNICFWGRNRWAVWLEQRVGAGEGDPKSQAEGFRCEY